MKLDVHLFTIDIYMPIMFQENWTEFLRYRYGLTGGQGQI